MQSLLKNTIVVIGLVALLAVGYYLFVIERESTLPGNSIEVSQADVNTQAFLGKLRQIETINFSTDLFGHPDFESFVNFSTPIEAVEVGRDNPFVR